MPAENPGAQCCLVLKKSAAASLLHPAPTHGYGPPNYAVCFGVNYWGSLASKKSALVALCHIFFDLFLSFPTLGCGVHIFNSILRYKILEKNLLRLLGVDVRSDTLGLWKNNLLVVCRLII